MLDGFDSCLAGHVVVPFACFLYDSMAIVRHAGQLKILLLKLVMYISNLDAQFKIVRCVG